MQRAIGETQRRRHLQQAYNEANGINPTTIIKAITDILAHLRPAGAEMAPVPGRGVGGRGQLQASRRRSEIADLPASELGRLILTLEEEMRDASADLRFEYAASFRYEIADLRRELAASS